MLVQLPNYGHFEESCGSLGGVELIYVIFVLSCTFILGLKICGTFAKLMGSFTLLPIELPLKVHLHL